LYSAINIESADMYWTKDSTWNVNSLANVNNTFDSENLIVFNPTCSLMLTGPLTSQVNGNDTITPTKTLLSSGFRLANPWALGSDTTGPVCGFMDLVGFGTGVPCISES